MKILLLADRMETGGAETHVAQLALGLRSMGAEVVLLSGGGTLADRLEQQGIRQIRTCLPTHSPLRLLALGVRLRRLVRREGFDLLHAHTRLTALLLRGIRGAAKIVTAHAKFRRYRPFSRLFYWGEGTVAVSEDLRRELIEGYRLPAERIRVIANGVDCARFSPSPLPAAPHAPQILFVSRLDEDCARGAALLCELAPALAASHPGVRISIAGGGNAYTRIRDLAEAANRRIGVATVTLLGQVEEMTPLLRDADLFVGVSRAAMEAAACGCAVILCGDEGYLGILDRQSAKRAVLTNLCARGEARPDAEGLLRDLRLLLDDVGRRRRAAEEARELILSRFSADRMCRETLAYYHRMRKHPQRRRLLVGGYFGCGNLGDDAILAGLLEELHTLAPDVSVTALTARPHIDRRRFGIHCVQRKNPLAIAWTLGHADGFLCGGGSLLQNLTSNRSLTYYLSLVRRATRYPIPVCFYAAGIGPLLTRRACRRTVRTLARCRYISLRDDESRRLLLALGVDASLLHEAADPALLLPPPPMGRASALLQEGEVEGRYLCIVLKGGQAIKPLRDTVLAGVMPICRARGLVPLFLVLDEKHDGEATRIASRRMGGRLLPVREVADVAALLGRAEGVVTMRLHAMILASAAGTPALGIPADPRDHKIAAFARSCGEEVLDSPALCIADVAHATEQLLENTEVRRRLLLDSVAEMRKKARKDLENIVQMLYNNTDRHEKRTERQNS